MPLKLIPPRKGKTPYWYVRGTYLGVPVDRSTKLTERAKARKLLIRWREEIERGEFARSGEATFLSAAVAYMKAGGDRRFMQRLLDHFGETPLRKVTQEAIDAAAFELYPNVSPASRNRQVHTVVSAVLKYAKVDFKIRRPKGARGKARITWLWPEQAFRLFEVAAADDPEFETLLVFLCYTGMRINEALNLRIEDLRLSESFVYLPDSKNGEPRPVFLPPVVVAALANHPRGLDRPSETIFRFRKCGYLYRVMRRVRKAAGPDVERAMIGFHTLCHTWATWMRRYAGLDTHGLVGTGRWKDPSSAARYEHVVADEESRKATLLPTPSATPTRGEPVEWQASVENLAKKQGNSR